MPDHKSADGSVFQVPFLDMRSFVNFLERRGDLVRVKREVDPKYEMAAVLSRLEERDQAGLFEKVRGSSIPVVGELYQNPTRMALALGLPYEKEYDQLEIWNKVQHAIDHPTSYREVTDSPVKEVVKTGDDVNMRDLPVPTIYEEDGGPFITMAADIVRNEETGVLNFGVHRIQVFGKNTITLASGSSSDLWQVIQRGRRTGKTIDVAVAIGVDPASLFAAVSSAPSNVSELEVAGTLRGKPLEVVRCETVDLLAPANAEIIIEGKIDTANWVLEGPFGEWHGLYGGHPEMPLTKVTAICRRSDAIFEMDLGGRAKEHLNLCETLTSQTLRLELLQELRSRFSGVRIKDLNIPWSGCTWHMTIAIKKRSERDPKDIIDAAFNYVARSGFERGVPLSSMVKRIVVVDEDIDIHNIQDIDWALASRVPDESRIIVTPNVPTWTSEFVAKPRNPLGPHVHDTNDSLALSKSCRISVDATMPLEKIEELKRPKIPGIENTNVKDYL
jgi:2,5-furandicarboxylate decarboxylase 1